MGSQPGIIRRIRHFLAVAQQGGWNQQAPMEYKEEGQHRTIGTKSTGICWVSREWYTAADSLG